jgi:Cu+-exporting ATPase
VRQALADKNRKVRDAEADRAVFLARWRARTSLSWSREWALLHEAVDAIACGQAPEAAWADYARRRRDELAVQAALMDFRLFWDSVGLMLKGREKLLIDADKVNGKRNLFLFDPEVLRLPPVLMPPERAPPK